MSSDSIEIILDALSRDFNHLTAAHAFSVMGLGRIRNISPRYPNIQQIQIRTFL